MIEPKTIAVSGYRLVLDDGPEPCSSESSAEYSDYGEELTGMYTEAMIGEDGKPVLGRPRMTEEQANRLRNTGRAGGSDTVSGIGRQEV
jgi:hypothetical protein